MSRVDNVVKNMKFAILCQGVMGVVNFGVRRVFAIVLEQNYLGLSGLFTDILSMLSLAELGFGTSILFSLYKPVAEGDTEKIKSLMALYRKAYQIIGLVVLGSGLALTPFLDWFVKEMPEGIPHIQWIYVLNVVNSALSYFFIYKATLLFACQQKYVEMLVTTVVKTAAGLVQIGALLLTVAVGDDLVASRDESGDFHTAFSAEVSYVHADSGKEDRTSLIIRAVLSPDLKIRTLTAEETTPDEAEGEGKAAVH